MCDGGTVPWLMTAYGMVRLTEELSDIRKAIDMLPKGPQKNRAHYLWEKIECRLIGDQLGARDAAP